MSRSSRFLLFLVVVVLISGAGLWILGSKKSEYSTSVIINAQPKQIFPYLTQPDRLKKWISGLKRVDEILPPVDGHLPQPKMVRQWVGPGGKESRYNDVVIRFTPDELVSVQSSNSGKVMTSIYQLESKGAGKTLLTYQIKSTNVGLGRFIAPLQPVDMQDQIADDARKLKELVEKNEPKLEAMDSDEKNDASYTVPSFGEGLAQPAGLSLNQSSVQPSATAIK